MAAPEDTFAAVGASLASAPRTPWLECALHTGRFLTSAAWFLWNWPQLHHAPVCDEVFADREREMAVRVAEYFERYAPALPYLQGKGGGP